MNNKKTHQKLQLLESFRGIAALLIVAFHTSEQFQYKFNQLFLFNIFDFGDSGVDFFFVLSGFLLALTSHHKLEDGRKNNSKKEAKSFLIKRYLRIYPFYWLITLAVIPVFFIVPGFGGADTRSIGVIIKSLLLFPQENLPILVVAWFLSHIVFFYLIFGFLMLLKPRYSFLLVTTWLTATVIYLIADYVSGFNLRENTHYLISFAFNYHNLEFFVGYVVSLFLARNQLSKLNSNLLMFGGVSAFLGFGMAGNFLNVSSFPYYDFFAYGLSSVLIVVGAASLNLQQSIKIPQIFLMLGAASYSIYLTHYLTLSVVTKLIQATKIENLLFLQLSMTLAFFIAVLIGYIIYRQIETRLNFMLSKRLSPK